MLSAVGLIPAAAVGVDIRALRAGAHITLAENFFGPISGGGRGGSHALALARLKHALICRCSCIIMIASARLARWHRQCWAESLGKQGHGSTLIPSRGASDQHSQLQLYLEGPADKCFTALIKLTVQARVPS